MGRAYDVSLNNLRFLMVKRPTAASDAPPHNTLIVVQNWTEELKRQASGSLARSNLSKPLASSLYPRYY